MDFKNPLILKYAILAIVLFVCIFCLGRCTAPLPSKDSVCPKELRKITELEGKLEIAEKALVQAKSQLAKCEDSCDSRLRERVDLKDLECKKDLAKALLKQKERYLNFKCAQCKGQGYCK